MKLLKNRSKMNQDQVHVISRDIDFILLCKDKLPRRSPAGATQIYLAWTCWVFQILTVSIARRLLRKIHHSFVLASSEPSIQPSMTLQLQSVPENQQLHSHVQAHGLWSSITAWAPMIIAGFFLTPMVYLRRNAETGGRWVLWMALLRYTWNFLTPNTNATNASSSWMWYCISASFYYYYDFLRICQLLHNRRLEQPD